ncbi:DUF262 domain-containing protein [Pseudenhygromyxa sp. WMMC2535]|uniref:DUF262 domain-containing protein n=1 Tax=Pseudenhygromyxa sp. WMMC2535 TaxID=2712867 RepID=UPI001551697E|nr:DUF262 domain-containing protein [Pseudenhygromyxa sp. WMMC2535]NVB43071.1 DUF262 domain-containing protein [Pseudenhygromyxa sp. WMMC2535]
MAVEDVIKLASEGRPRMPIFQRDFRWEAKDRRDLLDSIYRGYPVGTLLLWKNPPSTVAPSSREGGRALGGAVSGPPGGGDRYLVIDGQQRLTTLWEGLGRAPALGEVALVFDIEREEVISRPLTPDEIEGRPPQREGTGLPQVPLHLVLDAALLSAWVPPWMSLEDKRRYFELGKRIREHKLGLYIVEHAEIDALRHVFDRVNSTGKSMRRDEVFNALIWSQVSRGGNTGLALVNAELAELGFGEIPHLTILKAFEAIRGGKVGKLDPRKLEVVDAEADLIRTAKALRATVAFLRGTAHVPHVAVRPYELPIVVLARFFALHPAPSERSLILLRRWLWRGSLGERLGGASGSMQQHVDDVRADEAESVQALLRRTGSPEGLSFDDDEWSKTSASGMATARGKAMVCALIAQWPRSLRTGERLDAGDLFRNGSSDGVQPILRDSASGAHRGRGMVNKLLHPPGTTARALILECTDEAALVSHGIDAKAREALRQGNVEAFYDRRERALRRSVEAFFARHVELERDDAPSIAMLARRSA